MSRSAGPGSPLAFFCSACRRRSGWSVARRAGYDVVRTGRTRKHRSKFGSARGVRSLGVAHEYRCRSCGHIGWSAHVDMERKPRTCGGKGRAQGEAEPTMTEGEYQAFDHEAGDPAREEADVSEKKARVKLQPSNPYRGPIAEVWEKGFKAGQRARRRITINDLKCRPRVGSIVYETAKQQVLYVKQVGPIIGMAYRRNDPIAVTATRADFMRFFLVLHR